MISFDVGTHRFNLRAAAIVLHNDRLLLHRIEGDDFWSVPGGRINDGEGASEAIVREMQEELSESVVCERLLWTVENFFIYRTKKHHEIGLYFLVRLLENSHLLRDPGPFEGREGELRLTFDWFDLSRLQELNIRPSIVAPAIAVAGLPFQHLVHYEPNVP